MHRDGLNGKGYSLIYEGLFAVRPVAKYISAVLVITVFPHAQVFVQINIYSLLRVEV